MRKQIIKLIGVFILLLSTQLSYSQTSDSKKDKAAKIAHQAIKLMDDGYFKKSIQMFKECKRLDPENIIYPYEIAYAYYLKQDYKKTIKILERIKRHKDAFDLIYQILGNAYDYLDERQKALSTYTLGLQLFPYSGTLNFEMGIMSIYYNNDLEKGLNYFEKGIEVQPMYPGNYYWASKIYINKNEKIWGLLYGEVFMNLERTGNRNSEISKLLYDTYKKNIQPNGDTLSTSLFSDLSNLLDSSKTTNTHYMSNIFASTFNSAMKGISRIDMNSLDTIRKNFIDIYFQKGFDINYPNVLFTYQRKLQNSGHLEAYNHWILMHGDEQYFNDWKDNNEDKWKSFIDWFIVNGLKLDDVNRFHRQQYD
ncbi:MAG: hypothetical protein J5I91_08720 [Bacteroidetes bacterium]|nr:hypothetical protein [Bacteroidota bacterium]